MIPNIRKPPVWVIPVMTIIAVTVIGLLTFLVIGFIADLVDGLLNMNK